MLFIAVFIILIIIIFLIYLKYFTSINKLPKILNQLIYGSLMGLASITSIYFTFLEIGWKSVNASDVIVVLSTIIFGPISGALTTVFTLGFRLTFYLCSGDLYAVNYISLISVVCTLLISIFFNFIFRKNNSSKFFKIILSTVLSELIHLILIPLIGSYDLPTAMNQIIYAFTPSLAFNLGIALVSFLILDFIHKLSKGYSIKEYFSLTKTNKDVPIFHIFQFLLTIIFIFAFSLNIFFVSQFYTYVCYSNASVRYTDDLVTMKELIYSDKNDNPQTALQDITSFYIKDWSLDGSVDYLLVDYNGNIIEGNKTFTQIANQANSQKELDLYSSFHNDESYLSLYVNLDNDNNKIICCIPLKTEMYIPNIILAMITFFEILIFIVILFITFLLMNNLVVKRLKKVNESLEEITNGNLKNTIDQYTNLEFTQLSNSINKTVSTLNSYIEKESNRLNSELEIAKQIQRSTMPNSFPAFPYNPEIDLFSMFKPTKIVGGDFYDYFHIDKDKIALIIADVSGKSIPAAMFMMRAKSAIRAAAIDTSIPSEILYKVNNFLCEDNDACMFVTVWLGVLDTKLGYMDYCSAGHENPYIINSDSNKIVTLEGHHDPALGVLESVKFTNNSGYFDKGDKLVLYTDGITEAHDNNNNLFGEDNLKKLLLKHKNSNVKELTEVIAASVDEFSQDIDQFDDYCIVCLEYKSVNLVKKEKHDYWETEFTVISDLASVNRVIEQFETVVEHSNAPKNYIQIFDVCIDEIFSNIMKFGYTKRSDSVTIRIVVDETKDKNYISICFIDGGIHFNPIEQQEPDISLSAEERDIGGLGIHISKKLVDEMKYQYKFNMNHLTLIKYY